jgi:hypothetical protein
MTKYPLIEAMGINVHYDYNSDDMYVVHAEDLEQALQGTPVIYSGNASESWIALKNNSTIEPLTLDVRDVLEARVVCIQPIKKKTKAEAAINLLQEILELDEPKTLIIESIKQEARKILEMKD